MKKRRGVALPTAIALCSMMLIVSITVGGILVAINATNIANSKIEANELEFLKSHEEFVNSSGDVTAVTSTKYDYRSFEATIEGNDLKALVAYNKNSDTMRYYSIYDFTHDKVIAYQTSHLYVPMDVNFYYIGGIIPVNRS